MALRITSWNVNGIRNPLAYHPWCRDKSYRIMFDALEADILCLQETKIQRKDLTDDMALVAGWDSYFSFAKIKRGYSGVAVYTRLGVCQPLRAEEGITGILDSRVRPGTPYKALPPADAIGGYPELSDTEAYLVDSEGRALVLDFGAFVLIAVYCPANCAEERDSFRKSFIEALFGRVRNLVSGLGRHVVLAGDLNIARDEIDAVDARQRMHDAGLADWKSPPSRARLHRLLEPHPDAVMTDLCRDYFPGREGMFTHWDVRKNKRPGNAGSRLDYVLCSSGMKDWFAEANIQEGLMGSDHCPVYAVIKPKVDYAGAERAIVDIVNPDRTFLNGKRQFGAAMPPAPALSMKMSPEYSQRQTIREMFGVMAKSSHAPGQSPPPPPLAPEAAAEVVATQAAGQRLADAMSPLPRLRKPTQLPAPQRPAKRQKKQPGQTSLRSFLHPTAAGPQPPAAASPGPATPAGGSGCATPSAPSPGTATPAGSPRAATPAGSPRSAPPRAGTRRVTPRAATPAGSPRSAPPRAGNPRRATPRATTPAGSPRTATPRAGSLRAGSPLAGIPLQQAGHRFPSGEDQSGQLLVVSIYGVTQGLDGPSDDVEELISNTLHTASQQLAKNLQEPAVGPQESVGSPQEPASSPQEPVGRPQEPAGGPQEPVGSPQESAGGPQEPTGGPQELAGGPRESAGGPQEQVGGPKKSAKNPHEENDQKLAHNFEELTCTVQGLIGNPQVPTSPEMVKTLQDLADDLQGLLDSSQAAKLEEPIHGLRAAAPPTGSPAASPRTASPAAAPREAIPHATTPHAATPRAPTHRAANPTEEPAQEPADNSQEGGSMDWQLDVHDPIEAKERWDRIFAKRPAPRCDMHGEECIQFTTKKAGANTGRAFWVCQRPYGPEGESAVKSGFRTEWKCDFFKWASDV